jgi:hypothetical protein
LNIPKTVVLWILKEDLGKRKLCAYFVPHSSTTEQQQDQVSSCHDIIMMAKANKNFLTKFLGKMRAGVWPMTLKQSEIVLNGLMRHPLGQTEIPKVPHQDHVDHFFDSQCIVHNKFVPEAKAINAGFSKGVMDRLLHHIQRVHPTAFCYQDIVCCMIQHLPTRVCQFFTQKNVTSLYYHPYSQDLSLPEYFVFLKLKMNSTLRMFLRSKKP